MRTTALPPLLLLAALDACAPAAPPAAPKPPPGPRSLQVAITGVVARSLVPHEGPEPGSDSALEICPGDRLRPCSGVRVVGDVAPELLSTPEHSVVVRLSGLFDGARLKLDRPGELAPSAREPDLRNPCPQFQEAKSGDANPSPALAALAARIESEYPDRHAGTFWDRERQTLTVRVTEDASDIAASLKLEASPDKRLCLAGGAPHSQPELLAALQAITKRLAAPPAFLVEAWPDVVSGELVVRLENVDRAHIDEIHASAGAGTRIESFIELREGLLRELPVAPARGDVPLVTQPRRWSYGGMQALGSFRVRFDQPARCVYLETAKGERLLPIWPHGYAAYEEPLRITDFDGVIVSLSSEPQPFVGGEVPLAGAAAPTDNACGASRAWIGSPSQN
ncbi:MAG TPA: hypothetical protein VMG12_25750 [Polyangiaceae bacterium]|nr:hypothetical protein [Polyangiaceae bacterium]